MDAIRQRMHGKQRGLIPEVFRGQPPLAVAWHHAML
jgi:hypothetical protein